MYVPEQGHVAASVCQARRSTHARRRKEDGVRQRRMHHACPRGSVCTPNVASSRYSVPFHTAIFCAISMKHGDGRHRNAISPSAGWCAPPTMARCWSRATCRSFDPCRRLVEGRHEAGRAITVVDVVAQHRQGVGEYRPARITTSALQVLRVPLRQRADAVVIAAGTHAYCALTPGRPRRVRVRAIERGEVSIARLIQLEEKGMRLEARSVVGDLDPRVAADPA